MAAGTPVVAARAGALPETVGDAGVLADPGDSEAFTAAVLALLDDEGRRAELVAAGRRHAVERSWRRTAELTDQAVSGVLAAG
jgi:glycosyltransferase involved in cell wall biosynthesis